MKFSALTLFTLLVFNSLTQEKTLLYSIKKNGYKTAYVFGTMHIVTDSIFYFPEKLTKILGKTDELVMEIGEEPLLLDDFKLIETENGSALDVFSEAQKDSVLHFLASKLALDTNFLEKQLIRKKTVLLLQLFTQTMIQPPYRLVEKELSQTAHDKKLSVSGLETMRQQLEILTLLPDSLVKKQVLNEIRYPVKQDSIYRALMNAYATQDLAALVELIQVTDFTSGYNAALIDNRNKRWIPMIEQKLKTKSCFIAVGAGHLGGTNGLLPLLMQRGFTITPIFY